MSLDATHVSLASNAADLLRGPRLATGRRTRRAARALSLSSPFAILEIRAAQHGARHRCIIAAAIRRRAVVVVATHSLELAVARVPFVARKMLLYAAQKTRGVALNRARAVSCFVLRCFPVAGLPLLDLTLASFPKLHRIRKT